MSKRFFAFGCSFTQYCWLTWADMMALSLREQGYECYNFGISGLGNSGIASTILKADSVFNFTEDDIICVVWTTWNREDRFIIDKDRGITEPWWMAVGNIFNSHYYPDSFIEKYWSLENDIIKNCTAIRLCQKAYNLNFEGHYFGKTNDNVLTINKEYNNLMLKNNFCIKEFSGVISPKDYIISQFDGHPLPNGHAKYLTKVIQPYFPNLNLLTETTKEVVKECNNVIAETIKENCCSKAFIDRSHQQECFNAQMKIVAETTKNHTKYKLPNGLWINNSAWDLLGYMKPFIQN